MCPNIRKKKVVDMYIKLPGAATFVAFLSSPFADGAIEAGVANRAECQRFYGKQKLAQVEMALNWGAAARQCGAA